MYNTPMCLSAQIVEAELRETVVLDHDGGKSRWCVIPSQSIIAPHWLGFRVWVLGLGLGELTGPRFFTNVKGPVTTRVAII